MTDIIIVGAGTAGLSAAIYGCRSGKTVQFFDETGYGGQIINTPEIENYPGIKSISGFEFATGLYEQAVKLGAVHVYEHVTGIEDLGEKKLVHTEKNTYEAGAVILATGAKNRKLGLAHEDEWVGAGVSYCATCDGAFYKGKEVAVAGGGNTALEDAMFLSNYCSKVYLIHRRNEFRGEKGLVERLRERPNVEFVLNVAIEALIGKDRVEGVAVRDKDTGEQREIAVSGFFVAVGQVPENEAFANVAALSEGGYIAAGEDCLTPTPGIFTAGDCRTKAVRQLTTAAADGAVAALAACAYLDS